MCIDIKITLMLLLMILLKIYELRMERCVVRFASKIAQNESDKNLIFKRTCVV